MAKGTEHPLSLPVELTPPVTKSEHSWLYKLLQDSLPGTEDTNRGGIFSVTLWPKGKAVDKTKPFLAFSLVGKGRVLFPHAASCRKEVLRCFFVQLTWLSSLKCGEPTTVTKAQGPHNNMARGKAPSQCSPNDFTTGYSNQTR